MSGDSTSTLKGTRKARRVPRDTSLVFCNSPGGVVPTPSDGLFVAIDANGAPHRVSDAHVPDWFTLRCRLGWDSGINASEVAKGPAVMAHQYRGPLPREGNPLVLVGMRWLSESQLGESAFLRAVFYPTALAEHQSEYMRWASLSIDDTRERLSALKFDLQAIVRLGHFRRRFLNLDGHVSPTLFAQECADFSTMVAGKTIGWEDTWTESDRGIICNYRGPDRVDFLSDQIVCGISRLLLSEAYPQVVSEATQHLSPVRFMSSLVMSTFYAKTTPQEHETLARRYVKRMRATDGHADAVQMTAIVGIVNITNVHWTCFKIDGARRRITYIDSYGKPPPPRMAAGIQAIAQEAFQRTDDRNVNVEPFTLDIVRVYAQLDESTCGYHACWGLYVLLHSFEISLAPEFYMLHESCARMQGAKRWLLHKAYEYLGVNV